MLCAVPTLRFPRVHSGLRDRNPQSQRDRRKFVLVVKQACYWPIVLIKYFDPHSPDNTLISGVMGTIQI
jgi:hypothetical protein